MSVCGLTKFEMKSSRKNYLKVKLLGWRAW